MDLAALLKLGDRASESTSTIYSKHPEEAAADKGRPKRREEPRHRDPGARAAVEEKSE